MNEKEYLRAWWRFGLGIWCWDRGEPEYLAEIVQEHECPPQLLPVLDDIVMGRRKQKPKAIVKLKMRATNAAIAAVKLAAIIDGERRMCEHAEVMADWYRKEPIDMIRASRARLRAETAALAAECGVSVRNLQDTERALRRFVESLTK